MQFFFNYFFFLVVGKAKEMSFRRDFKMPMEGAARIAIDREFQSLGLINNGKKPYPLRKPYAPVAL